MTRITLLPRRSVIEVTGQDRVSFLQGLVSNDVQQVAPGRAVWAAFLTPQGKYLADFFILQDTNADDRLLLDCAASQAADLARRLQRYRLRAQASVRDAADDWQVHAGWDGPPDIPHGAVAAPDPRLPQAGWRLLVPTRLACTDTHTEADWNGHRLALGLPDGETDMEPGRTILLEAGFDELNGVSWSKGCYMGQELTARTKYRGLVKRRLLPVMANSPLPSPNTPILADGAEVGTLHAGQGDAAMATLRIDALGRALTAGGVPLEVRRPPWMVLPG